MAHLYAEREEDAFFGLGYAVGEDRLRQVLTLYLAARGELAAAFGPKTPLPYPRDAAPGASDSSALSDAIANDIRARKYRILEIARRNLAELPGQYQADLRAYIAGLREYMRQHPEKVPAWAPPLEPALPLALFHLGGLEEGSVCAARRAADRAAATRAADLSAPEQTALFLGASNAWAVAGSRTADGRVLFGSDSHGGIEAYGTLFYPYRIKTGTFDFMAFDPAGQVMFLFGHSPHFAWGITEAPRFVADCYRVETSAQDPQSFLFDGALQRMTVVPYEIAVKGAAPIRGTFEYTHHNGMLSSVEAREGNIAYVVSYASSDRVGLEGAQYYLMAKAKTRAEMEAALERRSIYPANHVIAGADGTIMYIRPGLIPIRPQGTDVRRTLDGNTSATAWRGMYSYAQALKLINPDQGYIINNNVSPDSMYPSSPLQPGDYPPEFAFNPGQTNSRQKRFLEMLSQTSRLTVDGARAIAMDETIIETRPWRRAFAEVLRSRADLLAAHPAELTPFIEELARFDGVFSKDSRGALYHAQVRRVLFEKHADQFNALAQAIEGDSPSSGLPLASTQQELLVQASDEARTSLLAAFGRVDLTFGDVHRVGRGRVGFPIGGGVIERGVAQGNRLRAASVRQLDFATDPKTQIRWLTSGQRVPFIVHFAASGVQSYAQTLWGVNEAPSSRHYSDQAVLASRKVLRPIPLSIAALKQEHATERVLKVKTR